MQAVHDNQIQVILCTEMPRLYRRMEELLQLIKMAATTRLIRIETTDGVSYDLSSPEGIHSSIAAVNNSMRESAVLSKRVKRKKAARARQGMPSGGHRAFGYNDKGMEFLEPERTYLYEAGMLYLAGDTVKQIVVDYNARGIVTTEGKPLTIENFQRTLFNKRNVGIRVHNGAEYPAVWPAIFTEEEYAKMDARRRSRAAQWPGRGLGVGRKYLLTGVCYCGTCYAYMIGRRRQIGDGYQRRYVCRAFDNSGQKVGCGKVFRGADPLDLFVTEAVLYRLSSPGIAQALAGPEEEDQTDELVKSYKEAKENLDQMVADYASGFLSRDQFSIAKRVAETTLASTRESLSKYQSRKTPGFPIDPEKIRESWQTMSLETRNAVIRLIVDKVLVKQGHPGSRLYKGYRFSTDHIEIIWSV